MSSTWKIFRFFSAVLIILIMSRVFIKSVHVYRRKGFWQRPGKRASSNLLVHARNFCSGLSWVNPKSVVRIPVQFFVCDRNSILESLLLSLRFSTSRKWSVEPELSAVSHSTTCGHLNSKAKHTPYNQFLRIQIF